jgi:hypothetical protein
MNKPGFPIVSEKGERRLKIRQKANFFCEKCELTNNQQSFVSNFEAINIDIFIIRLDQFHVFALHRYGS